MKLGDIGLLGWLTVALVAFAAVVGAVDLVNERRDSDRKWECERSGGHVTGDLDHHTWWHCVGMQIKQEAK